MMEYRLVRWLVRHQPREGWLAFLAAWGTLLILPAAVGAAPWVPGLGWLLAVVVLVGFPAAFGLSHLPWRQQARPRPSSSTLSGRLFGVVWALLGLLVVTLLAGWPEAPALPAGTPWYAAPWVKAAQAWLEMATRLVQWAMDVRGQGAAQDNAVFGWLAGVLTWGVVGWAVWWLFVRRRAFVALLPAGTLLATHLFYTLEGRWSLAAFVAAMAFLMALLQYVDREAAWQQTGLDFSTSIYSDTLLTGFFVALVIFALTLPMPRLVFAPTARWFNEITARPAQTLERAGQRLFPGLRRGTRDLVATGGGSGGLPRSFLLGSGPELSQQPVLRVQTSDLETWLPGAEPPQPPYWRALTYDTYTGRGWRNGPVEPQNFSAGEPWTAADWPHRRPLRQTVEVLRGGDAAFFAAGEPLAPNRRYQALLRSGLDAPADDLVAMTGSGRRYSVLSLIPAADEATLRVAGVAYPPGVTERYLSLPEVPQRVHDLARRLVQGADNPYDQALALERFLRTLPYDLAVSAPPPGRDVVDFFLFDARRGYCDYYATAMAVLARSLGIPARLAIGYATGDLDLASLSYLVAEDSAHSWPELYFPGVGWVAFEPTAARPPIERRAVEVVTAGQPPVATEVTASLQIMREDVIVRQRLHWLLGAAAAVAVAGAAWLVWRWRPEPDLTVLYDRLGRWGRRLGRPPGEGESAAEFGRGLSGQLLAGAAERAQRAAQGVQQFVMSYEAALYSPRPEEPARVVRLTWQWLSAALRRCWLARLWHGTYGWLRRGR